MRQLTPSEICIIIFFLLYKSRNQYGFNIHSKFVDVKNKLTSIHESFCLYLHLPWEIQDINGCLIRYSSNTGTCSCCRLSSVFVSVLATFLGISLAVSLQIQVKELI